MYISYRVKFPASKFQAVSCRFFLLLFFWISLLGIFCPIEVAATENEVKIGVLAKRGPDVTLCRWTETAVYLSKAIPEYTFKVVPLGFREIHAAAKDGTVDFVLTNPAFYVELESLYGVSRIATLINQNMPDQHTTVFGGVIFTRSCRNDIATLEDTRNHSFVAVDPESFGGWIMAWRELHRQGIDPHKDFTALSFADTHDAAVFSVRDGKADVGTVRSDTLERMEQGGLIDLSDFKVLAEKHFPDFFFLTSTELYPEWPMAATRTTPNRLARLVASALMAMEADHPAAIAGKYAGWTIPLNYQPVHDCLFDLRLGPYKDYGKFTLKDVAKRYWRQLALLTIGIVMVLAVAGCILHLNRVLHQKKMEVDELNRSLEAKVLQRTKKINALLDQEIYLRSILRTVADINQLLITSPTLECLLQESSMRLASHGHYEFCWIGLVDNDAVREIFTSDDMADYLLDPPYRLQDEDTPFLRSLTARCIRQNVTVVTGDVRIESDGTPWREGKRITGFQGVICLPLCASQGTEPLGVLTVYTWRKEGFEKEEIDMLEELAGDIGFAINSFRHREAVRKLEREREANYEETIFSLVNMIEHRDTYTAGHTSRVGHYSEIIAREMGLGEDEIKKLQKAAVLHDIGKIATPDSVLLKPGMLSGLDYDLIQVHAYAGYEILSRINMYKDLAEIIRHHHERYDGKGYPDGFKGKEIPLLSRILTVADAFDAMTTNRIYKPRKEVADALEEMKKLKGVQFCPVVVEAALKVLPKVTPPSATTQMPKTDLEKSRFSYFFNDRLTGLYNEDYLQFILQSNQENNEFSCLNSAQLDDLLQYNKEHGWDKGNQLVVDFAAELRKNFPEALLFRVYGNDLVIVSRKHLAIAKDHFQQYESIRKSGVTVRTYHVDLNKAMAYSVTKLECLEIVAHEAFPEKQMP
jgi:two-component system, LuxR family, sensor histidine kinase TtrS